MAVTRKPVAKPDAARADEASPNEAAIRAVIERGGTVAGEGIPDEAVRKLLQLRLPVALIERIDGVRRAHDVPPYLKPIFGADVGEPRKFRQLFKRLETVRYRGSRTSTVSGGGRARGGRLSRAAFIPDSPPLLFLTLTRYCIAAACGAACCAIMAPLDAHMVIASSLVAW